jgi:hypothetical protein
MTTATETEWYAGQAGGGHQGLVCCQHTGRTVAVVYDPKDTELLAAAPELLTALTDFSSAVWSDCRLPADMRSDLEAIYHNMVRAAIAKATTP